MEPPVEGAGVVFEEPTFPAFLAAFSARRFCLDAEGAMLRGGFFRFLLLRLLLLLQENEGGGGWKAWWGVD